MSNELSGKRILIVTSNAGVEHDELIVPRDRLRERGAQITHAALEDSEVRTYEHDLEPSETVRPDTTVDSVSADAFDLLVVPGGTVNADTLRTDSAARKLVQSCTENDVPVAAICHGPWLLIEAGAVAGKTLTSYPSLRTDLVNAGAEWVDEQMVRDDAAGWTLITSRKPDDLPAFVDAITARLSE
ncbi:type 1 glutamine amidotransferase [Nocardia yunnanensis]|uniref:Type 1 glutamine amidotransferase n=1 Tax=Nocardia yunnanensis TaxID=2382165 RepID=A0A386ZBN0_9NOCA|nr:type 1 glutamine amidotransferase domain-containing protein [Nocardia yunnanensis]AYF74906.1 type 1 glutamine amidotransferase [Nocardia yunnanensis]